MPEALFKDSCARRKFSFTLIQELSNIFQVSIMAVILRFIEVGSREFLVVISKNNVIRWYAKSHDFQKVSFKFKINSILPKGSISALFKSNSDLLTEIEIMDTDVWFINRYYSDTIYEQCYYSEINDYLITLIWFE
jgi:hypothetical protein